MNNDQLRTVEEAKIRKFLENNQLGPDEEAAGRDLLELYQTYNPDIVSIERLKKNTGELLCLKITVHARSHYVEAADEKKPKECDSMWVTVSVPKGYPAKPLSAHYSIDHRLASANVFKSGIACIDRFVPYKSTLPVVVDKLVNDMIHNTHYNILDSPANLDLLSWHKKQKPTIDPRMLYRRRSALPPVRKGRALPHGRG